VFRKKKKQELAIAVPRAAIALALDRATLAGDSTACDAARRLLTAIDQSPVDYIVV